MKIAIKTGKIFIGLFLLGFLLTSAPQTGYAHAESIDCYEIFEEHGTILLVVDPLTGNILHVNQAAAGFYGYTVEQLEAMKIQSLIALPVGEVEAVFREIMEQDRHNFILEHRLANNEIRTVEINSYPYTGEKGTMLVAIVNDITNRVLLEKKEATLIGILFAIVILLLAISLLFFNNIKKQQKQNKEIQSIKEDLHLILDSAAEGIYGLDTDGNCTFCNASCLKILGYADEKELLGKNMHWQIHYQKEDGSPLALEDCHIFKAFSHGEDVHIEGEVFWRADGTAFPAAYYSHPQIQDGKIVGAVVTFADITERKEAEKELLTAYEELEAINLQLTEQQYSLEEQNAVIEELNAQLEEENEKYLEQRETLQAIVDSLGGGVVMFDLAGRITFINEAWKDLFNYYDYDQDDYLEDNFYLKNETSFGTELFIRNMLTGIEGKDEVFSKLVELTKDMNSRYAVDLEQLSPIKRFLSLYSNPCISAGGKVFGRVMVVRDVSHQKEVDRLKLELISTVSHELRTPMSSIMGFSELLLTRELPQESHQEFLSIINSESKRLTNLINDFLDIQKMESGKAEFEKEDNLLAEIIQEAIRIFGNISGKHKIVFNLNNNDSLRVFCDRDKILQVVSNFLSNAIKYSPAGGDIKIDLTVADEKAHVSVTDQGLGIPKEAGDKVFSKFYRVNNDERRRIGGTGLGLAISKEIIEAHGGEIGFTSTYGQGSSFYFSLPTLDSGSREVETVKEDFDVYATDQGLVLIVEDDAAMVKLIKEILKDENVEMHSIDNGEEAIQLANKYGYNLFILDIFLKGQLNGWDVLKRLKGNPATVDTPIIISSAYENKKDIFKADISDYLVKPFESEQLIKVVRKALNGMLKAKMVLNSDEQLIEYLFAVLKDKGIEVRSIEHSGNMLMITLNEEEGLLNGKETD
ncbi:MAG: PAS domain S-box protein [Bacillota bacterium]